MCDVMILSVPLATVRPQMKPNEGSRSRADKVTEFPFVAVQGKGTALQLI